MKKILKKIILRGDDPTGHGNYGAKRGTRKHKGLDLVTKPDEDVFAPISGQITKLGYPYSGNLEFRYVEITNDVYRVRIMYCKPINLYKNQRVFEGQKIGEAQDIAGYWNPRMKNHIHLEVYKHGLLTDAEPLIVCAKNCVT